MKIIRYKYKNSINIGLIINKKHVINIKHLGINIDNIIDFIDFLNNKNFQPQKKYNEKNLISTKDIKFLRPIDKPNSLRDAYAFGGALHCATADVYREGKCEDYFPKQI